MTRGRTATSCLIALVPLMACVGRNAPGERRSRPVGTVASPVIEMVAPSVAGPAEPHSTDSGGPYPTGGWEKLEGLSSRPRLLVYLKNGVRLDDRYAGMDPDGLLLESGRYERAAIAAITRAPDNLRAEGAAIGAALGMGSLFALASSRGDFTTTGRLAVGALGAGAGAASGALIGMGWAKSREPLYVEGVVSDAGKRNWRIRVEPEHLAAWISNRTVQLMLRDGRHFKGNVLGGDGGSIRIQVAESSEDLPRGRSVEFAADRISTVVFHERIGGEPGTAAFGGGLAGFLVGIGAGAAIGSDGATLPTVGVGVGAVLGSAAAAGLARDRNRREITLLVASGSSQ
jgi:hypothetical protein